VAETAEPDLDVLEREFSRFIQTVDPATYDGRAAEKRLKQLANVGRLAAVGTAMFSHRVAETGTWKASGEASCTSYLASVEGVSRGQAKSTLDAGKALTEFPMFEQRAREGTLSQPKLTELTTTLRSDPDSERSLLSGTEGQPLWTVKEQCQRVRATSSRRDPLDATRRIRADRHLTWWSDAEGAFCFQGRDTADRGAAIRDRIQQLADDTRRLQTREGEGDHGERLSDGALRMDALFTMITERPAPSIAGVAHAGRGQDGSKPDRPGAAHSVTSASAAKPERRRGPNAARQHPIVERPPRCNVLVRVDLTALLRGRARSGECCEIDGQGPIPVPMARDLANDSFLRLVFHRADDIKAVSTLGRTVKRHLRIALAARDRCCVVPGCGAISSLEIDHIVPFAEGGPTELDNLALLCHHHHFLKTFDGWRLIKLPPSRNEQAPRWRFEPPAEFGQEPDLGVDTPEGRRKWRSLRE
jgi:hypothetical protein